MLNCYLFHKELYWQKVSLLQIQLTVKGHRNINNELSVLITFQHGEVHCIVGFLRNTEHHLQAVLDLSFTFFTASQQLLNRHAHTETMRTRKSGVGHQSNEIWFGGLPSAGADTWWFSARAWSGRKRWSWPVGASVEFPAWRITVMWSDVTDGDSPISF